MRVQLYNNGNQSFWYEPLRGTVYKPNPLVDGDHIIQLYRLFLMNSQYIYDFVDSFYITSNPRDYHCMHDLFIYGFNDDKVPSENYSNLLLVTTTQLGRKMTVITVVYGDGNSENCDFSVGDWYDKNPEMNM